MVVLPRMLTSIVGTVLQFICPAFSSNLGLLCCICRASKFQDTGLKLKSEKLNHKMEKGQLDFHAPLMSTRRYSSPSKSSELVKWKVLEKPQPCRQQSLKPKKPERESEVMSKPVAVPFHWEQSPGRPKGEAESHSHTSEESNTPRLSPARVSDAIRHCSGEIPKLPPGRVSGRLGCYSGERSNDQNVCRPQVEAFSFTDHASLLEKLNDSLKCRDDSDSGSGDDAYSDALETLPMSQSWSFNYSVTGSSGCQSSSVKPSRTFCVDTQTRDFMMSRFLQAAKAVVLETPEYAVKETTPKQVKKAVSGEMKLAIRKYSSDALAHYSPYINYIDKVESEDEDQDSSPPQKSGKTWGILPRFCVKNSLCLFNPLPALKLKTQSRCLSPSREIKRMTRKAHSGPLDQDSCQVAQKKKFHSGILSRDLLPGLDNNCPGRSVNSSGSCRSAGVSPLRRYRSGNISPYRNESPKSPFREGVGFLGVPKEETLNAKIASSRKLFRALQDVSRNQMNEKASVPTPTVCIDYVKKKDLSSKMPSRSKKAEEFANSLMVGSKKPSPKSGPTAKVLPSAYQESRNEVPGETQLTVKEEQKVVSENGRELDPPLKSPLPPPLPKSPSESWLWRTLPSISLGNPFANSRHQKKQGQKISATNTKWETIVKTSNLQHDHARYSEELVGCSSYRPIS